jgi:hypothetical protein
MYLPTVNGKYSVAGVGLSVSVVFLHATMENTRETKQMNGNIFFIKFKIQFLVMESAGACNMLPLILKQAYFFE